MSLARTHRKMWTMSRKIGVQFKPTAAQHSPNAIWAIMVFQRLLELYFRSKTKNSLDSQLKLTFTGNTCPWGYLVTKKIWTSNRRQ